jgi:hypothetical protein
MQEYTKEVTFYSILEKKAGDEQIVKGFASLNDSDRDRDFISPESFDLPRFLNNPQLLFNHKFWKDANGNEINIGQVKNASVASVRENDDDTLWSVVDDEGKVLTEITKEKHPDLGIGRRGLFVEAHVTVDDVWDMVDNGDLNTFSWKGMVALAKTTIGGVEHVFTKAIDLLEVSLVLVPANGSATFEIAKDMFAGAALTILDMEKRQISEMKVHKVQFSAELFTHDQAVEFLKNSGLMMTELSEENGELVSTQMETISDTTYSLEIATGVQVIVAEETSEEEKSLQEEMEKDLTKTQENSKIDGNDQRSVIMGKRTSKKEEKIKSEEVVEETLDNASEETAETETDEVEDETTEEDNEEAEKSNTTADADVDSDDSSMDSEDSDDTTEDTEDSEEDVEETTKSEVEGEAEKGAVQDQLDDMANAKFAKLRKAFEAIAAFDEVVWQSPNDNEELQLHLKELASILTEESTNLSKSAEMVVINTLTNRVTELEDELKIAKSISTESTESEEADEATEEDATDDSGDQVQDTDTEETEKGKEVDGEKAETAKNFTFQDVEADRHRSFSKSIMTLVTGLDETHDKVDKVNEKLQTMQKTVVSEFDRDENASPPKKKSDLNDVFGSASALPFTFKMNQEK